MAHITDPVTSSSSMGTSFTYRRFYGYFDGNGYSINLNIVGGGGLFAWAGGNASNYTEIRNLTVYGTVSGPD